MQAVLKVWSSEVHAARDWTLLGAAPPAKNEAFVRTGLLHKAAQAIRCKDRPAKEACAGALQNVQAILGRRPTAVLDMWVPCGAMLPRA